MCQIKCANCGATNNIKLFASQPRNRRRHAFESTVTRPRFGWLRYVLRGGDKPGQPAEPEVPPAPPVELWTQLDTGPLQRDLLTDIRIQDLEKIARLIVGDGLPWTEKHLRKRCRFTTPQVRAMVDELKTANLLFVNGQSRTVLTPRFMAHLRKLYATL